MDYFHDHYIDDAPPRRSTGAPRRILHTNLGGLPPASWSLVAGYDPLRDEGLAYAQKLTEAGTAQPA
jgi:acetyl esterase